VQQRCLRGVNFFDHGRFIGYAQARVDLMEHTDQHRQERARILRAAHGQSEVAIACLIHGEIFCGGNVEIERTFMNVIDHANDLPLGWTSAFVVCNALADGVLAWKILSRKRLIDHGYAGHRTIVGFGEESSADQPGFERRQITRAHMTLVHFVVFAVVRSPHDSDSIGGAVALHREHAGKSC
jgi:hypothetical protein